MHFYAFYHTGLHRFPHCGGLHFPKSDITVLPPDMLSCKMVWTLLHQEVEQILLPLYRGCPWLSGQQDVVEVVPGPPRARSEERCGLSFPSLAP